MNAAIPSSSKIFKVGFRAATALNLFIRKTAKGAQKNRKAFRVAGRSARTGATGLNIVRGKRYRRACGNIGVALGKTRVRKAGNISSQTSLKIDFKVRSEIARASNRANENIASVRSMKNTNRLNRLVKIAI